MNLEVTFKEKDGKYDVLKIKQTVDPNKDNRVVHIIPERYVYLRERRIGKKTELIRFNQYHKVEVLIGSYEDDKVIVYDGRDMSRLPKKLNGIKKEDIIKTIVLYNEFGWE